MLVLFESEGEKSHRGKKFQFEIWNGCMFPVEKEFHSSVLSKFPFLINHPVLAKWLYLPAESEDFESKVELVMREIRRQNPKFGSFPKAKKSKTSSRGNSKSEKVTDTRRPRMFGDEPIESQMKRAQKISDLKNLGAESEKIFLKAGIRTPQQLKKLGWKKAMIQLCKSNPKNNHSVFAYAVIGALQGKVWSSISESDKAEARLFMKTLRETKKPVRPRKSAKVSKNLRKSSRKSNSAKQGDSIR